MSGPSIPQRSIPPRKAEILEAVQRVIINVGFTDMTVADIAREAAVSTSLVHYHFASKAAVVAAALQAASELDQARREANADGAGPVLDRLDAVLCGTLPERPGDAPWVLWIETWGEIRRTPAIRDVMAELTSHETSLLVRLIDEGRSAGELVCDDPAGTVARLCALRDGLAIQHTLFGATGAPAAPADQLRIALRRELGEDQPGMSAVKARSSS